ncbi:MAG: phage tail tube protein [Gemmataceae bacterium]
MGTRLGLAAKLYRDTTGGPVWSEITNVRDLTLNLETGEADVTTRGNLGWRAIVATLKEGSIEFSMVWDTLDAHFAAIRDAFLLAGAVPLAVMDGDITVAGSQGLVALFAITNFTRNEQLEEAITVDVTCKPTYSTTPPSWLIVP